MIKQFGFGEALSRIRQGQACSREAWGGREARIELHDGELLEFVPNIGSFCEVELTSEDLLARDWFSLTDRSDRDVLLALATIAVGSGDDFDRQDVLEELKAHDRQDIIDEARELLEEDDECYCVPPCGVTGE